MGAPGTLILVLCLAVCTFTPPGDGAQEITMPVSGIKAPCDGCPRHKSSATLVPSFTKTTTATTHHTTPPTTTRPTNHTTTHPTNHTTPHPTNHTTTHPTNHTTPHFTTAAPTLPPDAEVGNYLVKNGSDVCLRVQSGLQIRVQYENSSKVKLWGAFAVQPNRTTVAGTCSQDSATMNLTFAQGFLHFTFVKNKTQNTVYLHEVQASLSILFPETTQRRFAVQNSSLWEFEARLGHSFRCQNRSLALAPDFHLDALHEQLQAFGLPGGHFGDAEQCPEDRHSMVVPTIIGVVLLVLILIIVIAYVLGRHRSRGGYQTI